MAKNKSIARFMEGEGRERWLPIAIGTIVLAFSIILCNALRREESANLDAKTKSESEYLASRVEVDLWSRIPTLERLGRSWELRGGMSISDFEFEARSLVADIPGFLAIELVGKDFIVRSAIPDEGNEKTRGLDPAYG